MANQIHATAIIADNVEMGDNNVIGAYAVIEADVVMGDGNQIGSHTCVKRWTRMGNNNVIYDHAMLGGLPQHTGFKDPNTPTFLNIGDGNTIREFTAIHRSYLEQQATVLGNQNYVMCMCHIGHDCVLHDNITLASGAAIGGHVTIHKNVFIAGGAVVHQFVNIGEYVMLGGNAKITQDCLPYMLVDGIPAVVRGLNLVGLKRAGFQREDLSILKRAYRILMQDEGKLEEKRALLDGIQHPSVNVLSKFIQQSKRSFHRSK